MKITNWILITALFCLLTQGFSQSCDAESECACNLEIQTNQTCTSCSVQHCSIQCQNSGTAICKQCNAGFQPSQDFLQCNPPCQENFNQGCLCAPTLVNQNGVCSFCQVDNCVLCAHDNPNKCDFCVDGFAPNSDYSQCVSECPLQSHSSCQCLPSYSNTGSTCEECAVDNCLICAYNDPTVCDLCLQGFLYENNGASCSSCGVKFCSKCKADNPQECEDCSVGFEVTNTFTCQVPSCQDIIGQIFNGLSCSCPDGQYVSNSQCIDCPSNCEVCKVEGCSSCLAGYYVSSSGNSCLKCVQNCLQCVNDQSCDRCQEGLSFQQQLKICASISDQIDGKFSLLTLDQDGVEQQVVITCSGGCTLCASQLVCTNCGNGYYLDKGFCHTCSSNCKTCKKSDPTRCQSCYQGKILASNKECITCPQNCFKCFNKDFCNKCLTGYYLNQAGVCLPCSDTCKICGASGCEECQPGFTPIGGQCVQCLVGCSACSNIDLSCLQCDQGLYGAAGSCVTCPEGCKACDSAQVCTKCSVGYKFFNGDARCYPICTFPCFTCTKGSPTSCQSCYGGYIRNPNTKQCQVDTSCNTAGDCVACPSGKALIISQNNFATCQDCNIASIPNCSSCSAGNLNACSDCKPGFYLINGLCSSCPTQCTTCDSLDFCKKCKNGFYLQIIDNEPTGRCKPCSTSYGCATCSVSAIECKSCLTKFVLEGQKCISNERVVVEFQFTIPYIQFFAKINAFKKALGEILGQPYASNPQYITFKNITNGSVILDMLLTVTQNTTSQATANTISNIEAGTTIGGVSLTKAAKTTVEIAQPEPVDPVEPETETPVEPETEQTSAQEPNLGLILGLSIPLGLLALVGLFIAMKKAGSGVEQDQNGIQSVSSLMKLQVI